MLPYPSFLVLRVWLSYVLTTMIVASTLLVLKSSHMYIFSCSYVVRTVYPTHTHIVHSLAVPALLVLTMCHYFFLSPCAPFPNPIRDMYGKKLHDPYLIAACHVVEEPDVETEALVQEKQDAGRT